VHFVLVALCGFTSFEAEVMIGKAKFGSNGTIPAGAAKILRYAKRTFSGNAVHKFLPLTGTAVIGGAFRTGAGNPFLPHDRFFIPRILQPGIFKPLFKHIHSDHYFYP
jgi:hypothetical protein